MKRYSQYIMYALFLLFGLGCDEGKIYPDETVDSGRTATVSLSFTGLKAWPKENMLSLCAFGEDKSKPLQTQRISKPAEDGKSIQAQVFDLNCLSCHGGGSGLAGQLDLRDDVAYKSLVNVKAPLSEEGKNYVTPGNINNSFLLDILENNPVHKDMFNSSGKQEVLALIQGWILGGALDN